MLLSGHLSIHTLTSFHFHHSDHMINILGQKRNAAYINVENCVYICDDVKFSDGGPRGRVGKVAVFQRS